MTAPYHRTHADDVESDRLDLPSVPVAQLRGHGDGPIHIVRFTADGKYCITGAHDRTVRLWNPTRVDPAYRPPPPPDAAAVSSRAVSSQEFYGRPQQQLPSALPMQTYPDGHLHPVHAIATNSSSTVLLSASDKTVLATDLVTAQTKQKWWGHMAKIEYVACLGGGGGDGGGGSTSDNAGIGEEIYASASYDSTVRLWDARSRSKEPLMILEEAKDAVSCVAPGKGGDVAQIITSSVDGKVRTYDLRTAQLVTEDIVHPITSFSISSGGESIAASCLDGVIRLWDTNTRAAEGKKKVFQKFHSSHKSDNYKVECAFTSDNEYLISGSECGAVAVYPAGESNKNNNDFADGVNDASSSKPKDGITVKHHTGATCTVAACPQASRPWLVVSASYDGSSVVWASQANYDCLLD